MVGRPGTCRVTPSGPGRSARGRAYGGEAPRGSVDPGSARGLPGAQDLLGLFADEPGVVRFGSHGVDVEIEPGDAAEPRGPAERAERGVEEGRLGALRDVAAGLRDGRGGRPGLRLITERA